MREKPQNCVMLAFSRAGSIKPLPCPKSGEKRLILSDFLRAKCPHSSAVAFGCAYRPGFAANWPVNPR